MNTAGLFLGSVIEKVKRDPDTNWGMSDACALLLGACEIVRSMSDVEFEQLRDVLESRYGK